jgi:glyoxylase-like metal-dependent hydrolase (beta-lactamase superfamily II)
MQKVAMVPETPSTLNSQSAKPRITRHPDGIFAVDAEYVHPGHAAVHLIQHNGRGAFVDTGTNFSVPFLLSALQEVGLSPEVVDYVLLTHVHLDHAGGAGLLMRHLPNARLHVHPRGVPHMVDPSNLVTAAQVVYGEDKFQGLYGEILPVPQERIVSVTDGMRVQLGGRELELIHTPGHALHHCAIVDREHAAIFSGDTFGVSYRELDTERGPFILPTTSPSQFDPDQLITSIDRLMSYAPESIYLMHYSRVTDVTRLAESLKSQIREFVNIVRRSQSAPDPHRAIRNDMLQLWMTLLRQHGNLAPATQVARLLETDLELNAQGLQIWLTRSQRSKPS